ncbi:MAG: TetR/AcrR family transcriptional regulator [Myxococcota bacterium]
MQVKKEEVRKAILAAATEEFLAKGFLGTSMREIARKAGCSLSNLYNYFENKDDLFKAILSSTTSAVDEVLERLENGLPGRSSILHSYEFKASTLNAVVAFIDEHRDYLRLLLLRAEGSDMRTYKERLIERYAEICARAAASQSGSADIPVSRFFLRNVCSFYMNTLEEMLKHDLLREHMEEYGEELLRYSFFGFAALLQPELQRSEDATVPLAQ